MKPFEPQLVISRVKDLLAGKQPSGMWGGAPVAQGPVRQTPAPQAADQHGRPPRPSGDSLEAYFDHLDAAFARRDHRRRDRRASRPLNRRRSRAEPSRAGHAGARACRRRQAIRSRTGIPDLQGDPSRAGAAAAAPQRVSAARGRAAGRRAAAPAGCRRAGATPRHAGPVARGRVRGASVRRTACRPDAVGATAAGRRRRRVRRTRRSPTR